MTDQRSYPPKSTEAKGQLHDIADKATDQLKKGAAESAMQSAEALTEQAREYGEKAQKVVNQFKPLVEKSLKEQPMATLAGFVLMGFVLGALWKK
jgi:ElaB/YqjD/DUF883 family membrane-anchored ribosome-binding protein